MEVFWRGYAGATLPELTAALACGEEAEPIRRELARRREAAVAAIRGRFERAGAGEGDLPVGRISLLPSAPPVLGRVPSPRPCPPILDESRPPRGARPQIGHLVCKTIACIADPPVRGTPWNIKYF